MAGAKKGFGRLRASSVGAEVESGSRGGAAPRGRARRGRGGGRGRGSRGRGGRGAGGSLSPPSRSTTHTGFPPFEFVVDLDRRLCSRLHLSDSFAAVVDAVDDRPTGYWLQVAGCPNGPSWVEADVAPRPQNYTVKRCVTGPRYTIEGYWVYQSQAKTHWQACSEWIIGTQHLDHGIRSDITFTYS